jgi:acyl carrier protein
MSIRSTILSNIQKIAVAHKRDIVPLNEDVALVDSGLDSLCFAVVVAQLEDELGLDPLSSIDQARFPVTIGDFIKLYENAAKQ